MKKVLLFLLASLIVSACVDLFSSSKYSLEGTWGMVSGGIKDNGKFRDLNKTGEYYKTIEFSDDGTFTEKCGTLVATGTYKVKGSQSISYSYTDVSGSGPEYFVVHRSGSWTYYFWEEDSFTLYDYASSSHEVSMTFERIH